VSGSGGASRAGQASDGTASSGPAIIAGPDPSLDGQVSGTGPTRRPRGRSGGPRGRRRRWRAVLIALAVLGVAGAMAWVLLGSQLLVVRSVIVTGTQLVPKTEVLAVAGIKPGTPLIRVNTAEVAARVETIRQVQSAQVTRSWPDRVVITVTERTASFAVAAPGGGYDLVDAHGVLVRWAARRPSGLPLYLTPAAVASLRGDPDFAAASAVLGELPAQLRRALQSVTAPSPYQVTLRLADGVTVLWGGADRAAAKAEVLAVLMRTHAHYYDVSAPGSAVTK
jgi:cell division protein FtsQ